MDTSLILAKTLGGVLLLVGISALHRSYMDAIISELEKSKALVWLSGLFVFFIGMLTVSLYDLWTSDWRVIIPLLGWLCILKGVGLVLFPHCSMSLYKKIKGKGLIQFSGCIAAVMGLCLLYLGFAA